MEKHTASATSLAVAGLRAVHQLIDNEPFLLKDPVILDLWRPDWCAEVQKNPEKYRPLPGNRITKAPHSPAGRNPLLQKGASVERPLPM